MTHEEKLKMALSFLATTNAKGASYDYYDNKADFNRYENWLFKYLSSISIPDNEHYPIVTELAKRDLIDVHPPETKIDATPPNQIKISFKGMAYLDPNNQAALIAEKTITDLQIENLRLQNADLKKKVPYAIIGFVAGAILSGVLLLLQTKLTSDKDPIQIKVQIPKANTDTVYIINADDHNPKTNK